MNYFEFYDLKPGFILDEQVLKKKFLESSRLYHPDHFVLNSETEQTHSEEQSAYNNRAYKILSHTDSRLKYLLELKNAVHDEEVYTLGQDFLMEMLDLNDLILEDPANATAQLNSMEQELYNEIWPILKSYDHDQVSIDDLNLLKDYHYKKRYILRIRENLNKRN
ncbi:MAG: iron-sulfur cluster co-chaperone HscB C-terminal domain-containing protein [Saprospiraceae bacterium]